MATEKKAARAAAVAMAELYVWDAVVQILEGSTAPRSSTGQRAANRVIAICKGECHRRMREYEAKMEKVP